MSVNKFVKTGKIAKGTYGVVYSCQSPGGTARAMKCNIKNKDTNFMSTCSEMDINLTLGCHPHIISLQNLAQGENPFSNAPISPIMTQDSILDNVHFIYPLGVGDLRSYMRRNLQTLDLGDVKRYMVEILLGLEYIHGRGYIHRDIKLDNILVVADGDNPPKMMIGDFGLAKPFVNNIPNTPGVMTCYYRAPEVVLSSSQGYNKVADIWSTGSVIYEIITGVPLTGKVGDNDREIAVRLIESLPYNVNPSVALNMDPYGYLSKISLLRATKTPVDFLKLSPDGVKRFDSIGGLDNFYRVLMKMLTFNPKERWSATELLNDPFFDDFRDYITKIRNDYPPVPKVWPVYGIRDDLIERKWMLSTALGVYYSRDKFKWYSDRILFHSIAIMDRVIHEVGKMENRDVVVSDNIGTIFTKRTTELYYISCLYFCIKYFTSLQCPIPFNVVASGDYCTKEDVNTVENFERILLSSILKYEVYRPTPYDCLLDHSRARGIEVFSMLLMVINGHHKNKTPADTYHMWRKNHKYYVDSATKLYK